MDKKTKTTDKILFTKICIKSFNGNLKLFSKCLYELNVANGPKTIFAGHSKYPAYSCTVGNLLNLFELISKANDIAFIEIMSADPRRFCHIPSRSIISL